MKKAASRLTNMYFGFRTPTALSRATLTTLKMNTKPLPKQPVPDLKQTAAAYLKSIRPHLDEDEYEETEEIVQNFLCGIGPGLQKKLIMRYEREVNWMSEWWLNSAYLGYRAPLILNSNPGVVGPQMKFVCPDDIYIFCARVIKAIWDYNVAVQCGNMKQEMVQDQPLDMQPYALILGTHRQPNECLDKLLHTDESQHIIIICNNNFYKLCLFEDSEFIPENKLVETLKDVVKRSCTPGRPIGALTGNDRDQWALDHHFLLGLGCNQHVVKNIECALFILCFDKIIPNEAYEERNIESVKAVNSLTGFSNCTNTANRWHDKTIQFVVAEDGSIGMEYEHSPCEGVPVAVLFDHIMKYIYDKLKQKSSTKCDRPRDFPKADQLEFTVNKALNCLIDKAHTKVNKLAADVDMHCFTFECFGSTGIKDIKLSPDSFIQIAMNVTYYKLHRKPPVHYESAALRRFENARTECIRSTSCDSLNFAKAMVPDGPTVCKDKKKELMIKAIKTHKALAAKAAMGQGVDRHLFGLRMVAKESGMPDPELFKDIGYTRTTRFNLTSSQVPFKTASFMCYNPVTPDGYGCCYNPRPDDILFACSSFKCCTETDAKKFGTTLSETLRSMHKLGC